MFTCQKCGFSDEERETFDKSGLAMKCPSCGSTSVEEGGTQPLEPGEHVDLDSGTTVMREEDLDYYQITAGGRTVPIDGGKIRKIAELAGYRVGQRDV